MSGPFRHSVAIYQHGNWITTASFRWRWQALAFHLLLNRSLYHAGSRHY